MDRLIAGLALIAAAPAAAQLPEAEQTAVLATVDAAMAAVSARDGGQLARVMVPGGLFFRQGPGKDGKPEAMAIPLGQMLHALQGEQQTLKELRVGTPIIQIQNGLAHVWTRYTFDIAGKRAHCGTDSFSLLKMDGQWRIASFGWTEEPEGCKQ
jgi:hypothetical protein